MKIPIFLNEAVSGLNACVGEVKLKLSNVIFSLHSGYRGSLNM